MLDFSAKDSPAALPLHEKLKSVVSHRVEAGGEVSKPAPFINFTWNRSMPHRFIFQYRPIDMLQALEIMPREVPFFITKLDEVEPELKKVDSWRGDQRTRRKEGVEAQGRRSHPERDLAHPSPVIETLKRNVRQRTGKTEDAEPGFFAGVEVIDLT